MENIDNLVAVVGHVAWPLTVLALAVLARKEIRGLASSLAARISDERSDISLGKDGLAIKAAVQAQAARIESLQASSEQIRSLTLSSVTEGAKDANGAQGVDSTLRAMADQYLEISDPDYSRRVRTKNVAADKMALHVVKAGIDKDLLSKESHEGLVLALASSILLQPETGDTARLLNAARHAKRLHVRYRVLLAFSKLIAIRVVDDPEVADIAKLLNDYEASADASLLKLIGNVRSLLREQAPT